MKKSNIKKFSIVALGLFLVLVVYLVSSLNITLQSTKDKVPFYQYSLGVRRDYENTSNVRYDKENVTYQNDGITYNIDHTPLYYIDEAKMMLPYDFSVVNYSPRVGFMQHRINHFATIEKKDDGYIYQVDLKEGSLEDCFLYDGKSTYVFLEPVYYYLDGGRYLLSPMSYVYYDSFQQLLIIYDYQKDEAIIRKQVEEARVDIDRLGFVIDLVNDSVTKDLANGYDKKLLLSSLDLLSDYEN